MKKFKPYDCVLVKIDPSETDVECKSENFWSADFYDRFDSKTSLHRTISGKSVTDENILLFNSETEYLHNTTEDYVDWKPKKGDVILVRDNVNDEWQIAVFDDKIKGKYVCVQCGYIHKQYGKLYEIDENETEKWKYAKPYVNPFKSIENNLTK